MLRTRTEKLLALIAVGVGLLLTAIAGLFAYITITTKPLHPDRQNVPSVTRSTAPAAWAAAVERGRQLARAALVEQNLPGLSVAVGVTDNVVWAEGFGYADLEKQAPVAPEMRFRIGEASIPLTSAAVGLLIEQNKLKLDEEIQAYVPEFPRKQWPVTLRQLMGHMAGLRNDAGDEESLAPCGRTIDGLDRFANDALLFEPGTRHRPSSYGWILVSAAVEDAVDEPFFTFMRTRIFEPLGMSATRPDSATDPIADRVTPYFPRFAGDPRYGPELTREGDHSCAAGGGAFLSTPSDLARFGLAIIGGRLLQRATVGMLQTPQRLASGEQIAYGLGWKLDTVPLAGTPARMAGHDTKEDFIGATASLATFPEQGIVVAVTSNTSFARTSSIALQIAQAFAEQAQTTRR